MTKHLIALLTFLTAGYASHAQIVKEHVYPKRGNFFLAKVDSSEFLYLVMDPMGSNVSFKYYNMNHKLIDSNLIQAPVGYGVGVPQHISRYLFDQDAGIEFITSMQGPRYAWKTAIYDDDGTVIRIFDNRVLNTIHDTKGGTKMILAFVASPFDSVSADSFKMDIYRLPGKLPTPAEEPIRETEFSIYPNPSKNWITVEYNLPKGQTTGNVKVYDLQGRQVDVFTVGRHFNSVRLNVSKYPSGTYLVNLNGSDVKKFVVD